MGLHEFRPAPSGRMGTLWTLASIRDAALLEFGCTGHMTYARVVLSRAGVKEACRLYSSHIDETDIALGGIGRIRRAVADITERDAPKYLWMLPSAVPTVIGTDLSAICCELQPDYPATKLIPFLCGGFDVTQHRAVEETLKQLVSVMPKETAKTVRPTFNVIGSCADLFRFQEDTAELVRIMEGSFGIKPLCILTSNTCATDIENMGGAHINFVIRREGEAAAKKLQQQFGTPYILARPYGMSATIKWLDQVGEILKIMPDKEFINGEQKEYTALMTFIGPTLRHMIHEHPENVTLSVGAHSDIVKGVLDYGCGELGFPRGISWCDSPEMASTEVPYFTESKRVQAVSRHKKGLLMTDGEALAWAKHNPALQISNPDIKFRLNPYRPPFVGFRGAVNLIDLWVNAAREQET